VADQSASATDKVRSLQDMIQKIDKYKKTLTHRQQKSDAGTTKLGAPAAASAGAALRDGAQGYNNSSLGAIRKRVRSSMSDGPVPHFALLSSVSSDIVSLLMLSNTQVTKFSPISSQLVICSSSKCFLFLLNC
jgi:hypothetical protein